MNQMLRSPLALELEVGDAGGDACRARALALARRVRAAQIDRVGHRVIGDTSAARAVSVVVLDQRREGVVGITRVVRDIGEELLDQRLVTERRARRRTVEVVAGRRPEDGVQCDIAHYDAAVVDDRLVGAGDELGEPEPRGQPHRVTDPRLERDAFGRAAMAPHRGRPGRVREQQATGHQRQRERRDQLENRRWAPHCAGR
jgi:hypothetical protein